MTAAEWVWPLLSLVVGVIGGWLGAWMGINVKVAVFEHRLIRAEAEIDRITNAMRTHDNVIQGHEHRLSTIERWKEKND